VIQKCVPVKRTSIGRGTSDSCCPEGVRCVWAGEIKVSVSIYEGKKLVTNEDLVISEKNDLVNKEWFTKTVHSLSQ
jgi:hypothetical protein